MLTQEGSSGALERPSHMLSLGTARSSLMHPSIDMHPENLISRELHVGSIPSARTASTSSKL